MPFSIAFQEELLSYPYEDRTTPAADGVLVLGDAKERFTASLYEWSKEDYQRQWRHAVEVLLRGKDKAALITEYLGPGIATHLEWWPMYVVGEKVFLQNHLLFYDQLPRPFSVKNALSFLRDRHTTNQEGETISEWSVGLSEVEAFARGADPR
ncbi:MAG: hypothetical protein WAN17_09250 [Candidatus Sulfotelmatobacter sp.]